MAKKEKLFGDVDGEDVVDEVENTDASVTEEVDAKKQAILEKRKQKADEYNAAKDLIRKSYGTLQDLLDQNDEDKALYQAIVKVVGQKRGAGVSRAPGVKRSSLKQQILDMFDGVGSRVNEFELFKKFKVGQPEMRYQLIIPNIKNVDKPEDRKWFSYDEETGDYIFVAEGADVPEGWDGYLPADESLL
mgnify:CR=1 FL=1